MTHPVAGISSSGILLLTDLSSLKSRCIREEQSSLFHHRSMGTCISTLSPMAFRISPSLDACPHLQRLKPYNMDVPPPKIQFQAKDYVNSSLKAYIYKGKSAKLDIHVVVRRNLNDRGRALMKLGSWQSKCYGTRHARCPGQAREK